MSTGVGYGIGMSDPVVLLSRSPAPAEFIATGDMPYGAFLQTIRVRDVPVL